MKIAVISDIHGNLRALRRVITDLEEWQPDQVVVDGDIVNRGPLSADCLHLVWAKQRELDWDVVKGNHEDYVLECLEPGCPPGPEFEVRQFAHWTYEQLNGEVPLLAALPNEYAITAPDGSEFRVVHASMRSNRDGIYTFSKDEEIREQIAPPPAVFVTAHTHRPLTRRVDETLVVNVGSVGAPFDGDERLSYGRFTWHESSGWQSEIVRLDYDWRGVEEDYVTSGFLTGGGPLAQLMLLEHRRSSGLIYRWASRYQDAVLKGKISLENSVRQIMQDEDVRPYVGPPGWEL